MTKGRSHTLTTSDLNEAEEWASRLGIVNYHDLAKEVLKNGPDRQRKLLQLSTLYGLRLFEEAGLDKDCVCGEQQRVEMYEHVIKNVEGMRFLGHVNSFDYKYFRKAVAEGAVDRSQPIYVQEFRDVQKLAHRAVKVPITGPYTLVDWSYHEYYQAKGTEGSSHKERNMGASRASLLNDRER